MTIGGRLVSIFPPLHLLLILAWISKMFLRPNPWDLSVLIATVYILPLVLFRIHNFFLPLEEGNFDLSVRKYSPWWASHMFQYLFVAVPLLEGLIHMIPGLFSMWLRAWGAKVGRQVHWTPRVEILDRSLIEVGDRCLLGHLTTLCSHMVAEIDGRPMLIIKKIRLGEKSFIGADTQLGPGADVAPRTKLKPKTRLYWRGEWT